MLAPPQTSTRSAQPGVDHPIELTAESLWSEVSSRLRGALNDTTFRTWFAEAGGAELDDESFILAVPNDFTRDWIEGHFLGLIGAAIRDVTGEERPIELRVSELGFAPALNQNPALLQGVNIHQGKVTNPAVAETFNLPWVKLL